jgi:hypothetical protein
MSLEHNERDCCGLWQQQLISGRLYWRCEHCEAVAWHSDAVAEAAIRENQLGGTLRQLSHAGDYLKLSASEEPWQW